MSVLTTSYQLLGTKYVGSSGGRLYVRVYAKYSEQDTINNKTYVYYQARAYYENSSYIYDQSGNGSVSGTGLSTKSGNCTRPTTGETTIATTEGWVPHNPDGTMSISASATLNFPNWGWSETASGSADLPTIPRATACPNLDGYIESSAPISLNPASTTFKHRLYYSYNGKTGYYPSSTAFFANTGSLSLDTSFYSYTPKSSGTGSITLYTYDSDGNEIGSKTGSITVRCDKDKCRPSIEATIIDINSITANLTSGSNTSNILIKGFSNAQITYTISPKNSAILQSKTINGSTLGTSPHTIYGVSTGIFNILAIDSRDFDTTLTKTNTLINYVPLTLDFNAFRPTPTGSEIKVNFQGNYFDSSFGLVNNTLSLSWKYRIKGAITWEDGGTFVKDTDYTINNNKFNSIGDISLSDTLFDYQNNYDIAIFYADKLIDTSTAKTVPKGKPVLNWEDELVNVNGNLTVPEGTITTCDIKCKNLLYTPFTEKNKLTLTATQDDFPWHTGYFAYLEAGKTYTFSCKTDGIWGTNTSVDTVEAYLIKDNIYINIIGISFNPMSFTVNETGNYYLRCDVNKQGYTHSFWNFQVEEGNVATDYVESKEFSNKQHYSSYEQVTGTYVDGKPLYRKTINCGALPNNAFNYIQHSIANIKQITKIYGTANINGNEWTIALPFISCSLSELVQVDADTTQIYIGTNKDMTRFNNSYVTLEYTKTTD